MSLSTVLVIAQTNIEKTLVKSFNLKGSQEITLNLEGDIDVQERVGEIVRVQMTIGVAGSEAMLKSLITAGRYNLKMQDTENGPLIDSPGLQREITVRGSKLVETISYVVYVPENVTVKYGSEAASDITEPTGPAAF